MNTKYINGQFVRNVATVLVAAVVGAFWACSNDESTLGGGVSEETRVTALNDITITGRAMAYVDASASEIDSAGYRLESEEFTYKDARVTVSELDSTTFEKTGVEFIGFVYDKDGSFKLDSVSFKSPYVLVRVEELARNLPSVNAVVDLRTTKNINLSVMTTLVCKRVLSLASSDMFGFSSLPAGYSKIDYVDEEAAAAYYDGEIDEEPAKGRIFKAEGLEAYFGIFGYDYVWLFGNNSYFKKRMWRADDVAVSIRCIKND